MCMHRQPSVSPQAVEEAQALANVLLLNSSQLSYFYCFFPHNSSSQLGKCMHADALLAFEVGHPTPHPIPTPTLNTVNLFLR
jgi:hypothetical protein